MTSRSGHWRRHRLIAAVAWGLSIAGSSSAALAQVGQIGPSVGDPVTPPPVATNNTNPAFAPTRDYSALPIGGWLLYPSLFVGGLWDSNPAQRTTNTTSSFGGRVAPSLLAQTSDGINQLTFYGAGDFRGYTNADVRGYDTANANVGAWERYQPTLDWVVNSQVNYTRQRDLLSTLGISNSVTQINTTGVGLAPVANQPTYNQYSAAGSVQKNFGTTNQLFMILGGSVVDINYDSTTAGVTPATDGITTTGTGRGGFWFTP